MKSRVIKLLGKLQRGLAISQVTAQSGEAYFLSANLAKSNKFSSKAFKPESVSHWFALHRMTLFWMAPAFGTDLALVPHETQFLLWKRRDGLHVLLIPLVDGDVRSTLEGGNSGLRLVWDAGLPEALPDRATVALLAAGKDPFALIDDAMAAIKAKLGGFRLRVEKNDPSFMSRFGWCTWDAFYKTVDSKKVLAALDSFARENLNPGFVILDDGWMDTDNDSELPEAKGMLMSFKANPKKFPNGLSPLIDKAKRKYGVKTFGVWHTLQGYWQGVNPSSAIGHKYSVMTNKGTWKPWTIDNEPKVDFSLVVPESAASFYRDFYRYLRSQGVDMVKVDNQSALEVFTKGKSGRGGAMRLYQEALQGAAQNNFLGNVINCMSNSSDVAFNMLSANVWRNSYDYSPVRSPQTHVFFNAMNALWTSSFSIPDWDMFQTHGPSPEFHAAARAVSGGPIYLSDKPGEQNFDILRKLTISDSRVLRFDRPALPAEDSIFTDCSSSPQALKLWTMRGTVGIIGLFHCQNDGGRIDATVKASDVPNITGRSFVAYHHRERTLKIIRQNDKWAVPLLPNEYEIITISPISRGIAPLGLVEKYAGAAALAEWGWIHKHAFVCSLVDGGRIGFYSKNRPLEVRFNNRKVKFAYDQHSRLLFVDAPSGDAIKILITFDAILARDQK